MTKHSGTTRAYLRISVARAESGSLAKQRERITASEVAAGRDPDAIEWYVDEGVSGSKAIARPKRDRLMSELRSGDRLVALKVDRLARNVRDLLEIAEHANRVGASLQLVDDAINTAGPMGKFLLTLLGALAEFEAAMTAERVKASRESFLQNGRHPAGPVPVGFVSVKNPHGAGLVVRPDPEMGPVVREACLAVMAGATLASVTDDLGITKMQVSRLMRNPRLAGMVPDGDLVVMANGHPMIDKDAALLSLAEFEKLQAHLGRPDKAWTSAPGLGAALRCYACEARLYRNKSKNKADLYRCIGQHEEGVSRVGIHAPNTDAHIEDYMLKRFGKQRFTTVTYEDSTAERDEALALLGVRIRDAQAKLSAVSSMEEMNEALATLKALTAERLELEAKPVERKRVVTDSGKTFADVWREAGSDAEREAMVLRLGVWTVSPGRGPVEGRLRFSKPAAGLSIVEARQLLTNV